MKNGRKIRSYNPAKGINTYPAKKVYITVNKPHDFAMIAIGINEKNLSGFLDTLIYKKPKTVVQK